MIKDGKSGPFFERGEKIQGDERVQMDAGVGGDRLRGLNEGVLGREMERKWAYKRTVPEGVGAKLPGGSVDCLVGGITGQGVTLDSSRQGSPMWQKSKRLQLTSSPSGTRDSEGGLCR